MWAKGEGLRLDFWAGDNGVFFQRMRNYVRDIMNGTTRYDNPSLDIRWWARIIAREIEDRFGCTRRRI